uniref:GA3ox2 n=1 Tax=Pinus tabuliformis TaxID=88731 RepID=X5CWJ3_PINTB|nr:GA3ox2 [Pinus tabuliformis]
MPSLSDAFKSVPVQCKEPDISSMDEVPELYLWPQENQQALEENIGVNIPVIDLQHGVTSRASAGSVIELLRAAYEEFGVFQIVNHGVSQQLLERVENQGRRLFSLPLDQKIKARRSPDGVTGYGMARICTFFDRLMWSEGFTSIGSPLEHAEKLWPDDYQDFCETIDEYDHAMKDLASKLMSLILESLGLRQRDYSWGGDNCAALQMNHYPSCPRPAQTMGMAEHTDSTFLTVLYQGSVQGLQIKRSDGMWTVVPAIPNAFVVNAGDLLQVLSNGRYKSVVHRAVNSIKPRLSFAYLWGPPLTAVIEPAPQLVDSKHPLLYRALNWNEYLVVRAKHFDRALEFFRNVQ